MPVALTIAGSDSGGGAGVQADVQAMSAQETFPTTVVTSVTAQHTRGVERSAVLDPDDVRAQYEAVTDGFDVRAAKTGMLATADVVRTVRECVAAADFPLVVDPVMVSTAGDRLLEADGERAYEDLLAAATLVTPNHDEAAVLTGVDPATETARDAGERLLEMGADAALVTGGHGDGDAVRDVLVTADGGETFAHPRVDAAATHGSGCSLSASITARLARGDPVDVAVERAIKHIERAIRYAYDVGRGAGAVHPQVAVRNEAARRETVAAVSGLVEAFVDEDVSPLVPEVGMNVVGATPYAESVGEIAAVDGRISRTVDGVAPTRGVRFGASDHLARFLLAAREHAPELRFVVNCRLSEATSAGLDSLERPVAWFDRSDEPESRSTMDWAAERVFAGADERPAAVADEGATGKEAMIRVVGETPEEVAETVRHLHSYCRTEGLYSKTGPAPP
jgi:hydroxymethylpyrimidine/phosphomethylpyrimidine kinase